MQQGAGAEPFGGDTPHAAALEEALKAAVAQGKPPLADMIRYQMGWADRFTQRPLLSPPPRWHGMMCLLTCEAVGGDASRALPAAAGLELLHEFCRLHGDIEEGVPERERRQTVWWAWGPSQAINAGDSLFALARLAILSLPARGLSPVVVGEVALRVDQATRALFEAQHHYLRSRDILGQSPEAYVQGIEARSGTVMGCAASVGALLGGANREAHRQFEMAGRKAGLAAALAREMAQVWEQPATELANVQDRQVSLPLIFALAHAPETERAVLQGIFNRQKVIEDADLRVAASIMERTGARTYCQGLMDSASREALTAIEAAVGASRAKDLKALVLAMVQLQLPSTKGLPKGVPKGVQREAGPYA